MHTYWADVERLLLTEGYAHDIRDYFLQLHDRHRTIGFDTAGVSGSDGLIVWTRSLYFWNTDVPPFCAAALEEEWNSPGSP